MAQNPDAESPGIRGNHLEQSNASQTLLSGRRPFKPLNAWTFVWNVTVGPLSRRGRGLSLNKVFSHA
jgi:hypothetical protein